MNKGTRWRQNNKDIWWRKNNKDIRWIENNKDTRWRQNNKDTRWHRSSVFILNLCSDLVLLMLTFNYYLPIFGIFAYLTIVGDYCSQGILKLQTLKNLGFSWPLIFFFFLNIFFNIYITSLRKRKSISQILLGLWFFKTCRNQHNEHQKNNLNYLLDLNYFRRNVNEIKLQAIFEKPDMPL